MTKDYAIIVDSASTYTREWLAKNNIYLLPLSISDKENNVFNDDGNEISASDILQNIYNGDEYKTAAPILGSMFDLVEKLASKYKEVFYIPISYGVSTTYNSALIVKQDVKNFHVIKSNSGAFANQWAAEYLIKLLDNGMKAEEACLKVEKEFEHICVYFSCENTDGLLKGGRVGPVARKLFKTFKIKPIINVDTTNHLAGIGKSFDGIITKIITLIKKQFDGTMDASNILHIGILNGYTSQERINHIIKKVKHAFNVDDSVIEVNYIPTTVLVHTYKGSYGIAVECSLKRKTILWKKDN